MDDITRQLGMTTANFNGRSRSTFGRTSLLRPAFKANGVEMVRMDPLDDVEVDLEEAKAETAETVALALSSPSPQADVVTLAKDQGRKCVETSTVKFNAPASDKEEKVVVNSEIK